MQEQLFADHHSGRLDRLKQALIPIIVTFLLIQQVPSHYTIYSVSKIVLTIDYMLK